MKHVIVSQDTTTFEQNQMQMLLQVRNRIQRREDENGTHVVRKRQLRSSWQSGTIRSTTSSCRWPVSGGRDLSPPIEISESDIENACDGPRCLGIYQLTPLSPTVCRPTRRNGEFITVECLLLTQSGP